MDLRTLLYAAALSLGCVTPLSQVGAIPLETRVLCGNEECGTMRITRYDTDNFENQLGKFVGVVIDGAFEPKKSREFHYIQAVIVDEVPTFFKDGSALPPPYLDAPPGGYLGFPTVGDLRPYYDQADPDFLRFPRFFDQPGVPVNFPSGPAQKLTVMFETWLVCVIEEIRGDDLQLASDDEFKVAPLLGWTWGFTSQRLSSENDFAGWATTKLDLREVAGGAPSREWVAATQIDYGMDPNKDRFNVVLGDCKECFDPSREQVPEPPAVLILIVGLAALVRHVRRRKYGKEKVGSV